MKFKFKTLLAVAFLIGNVFAEEDPVVKNDPLGSATLPLPELLKLYQATDRAQEKPKKAPPLRASITSIQFRRSFIRGCRGHYSAL